jgi:hypothetical protein
LASSVSFYFFFTFVVATSMATVEENKATEDCSYFMALAAEFTKGASEGEGERTSERTNVGRTANGKRES